MNYLNTEISFFSNPFDKQSRPITLRKFITMTTEKATKDKIAKLRATTDPDKRAALKKQLPAITPSGVFANGRNRKNLVNHSRIICIDFDYKDNQGADNFSDLKKIISDIPYVLYCGQSCSGKGFFVLMPIKYPHEHKIQCEAAIRYFAHAGLIADKACTDVNRLRFLSYDNEPYVNESAAPFEWLIDRDWTEPTKESKTSGYSSEEAQEAIEATFRVTEWLERYEKAGICISDDYKDWNNISRAFATTFGEAGRSLYHRYSSTSEKYSTEETDRVYNEALRNGRGEVTVGTFFELCRANQSKIDFSNVDLSEVEEPEVEEVEPIEAIEVTEQQPRTIINVSSGSMDINTCFNILSANNVWADAVVMNAHNNGYPNFDYPDFRDYLNRFFGKLASEGVNNKDPKDAMAHFSNWLLIQLKEQNKPHRTTKAEANAYALKQLMDYCNNPDDSWTPGPDKPF